LFKLDKNNGYVGQAHAQDPDKADRFTEIGNAIAADLIAIGIFSPDDLNAQNSLKIFNELKTVMGHRHDPCVYYTLLSVKHFMQTGESLPWWKFTAKGKSDLALNK
jgi:DNA transformation protein